MDISPLFNEGDFCLRTSLYITGKLFQKKLTTIDMFYWKLMVDECRLFTWFHHRKSKKYTWKKDVHGGKKSLRCKAFITINWVFRKLKLTKTDLVFYCGLNCDQYRGLLIPLYLTKDTKTSKKIARRIFWGYVLRLGFSPSLTEWAVIKPQSFILLFRMLWYAWPLYPISWVFWRISMWRNLKQPIKGHATNKISLLPTMLLLNYKLPSDEYICRVYSRYFKHGSDGKMIRKALIGGLSGGRETG